MSHTKTKNNINIETLEKDLKIKFLFLLTRTEVIFNVNIRKCNYSVKIKDFQLETVSQKFTGDLVLRLK